MSSFQSSIWSAVDKRRMQKWGQDPTPSTDQPIRERFLCQHESGKEFPTMFEMVTVNAPTVNLARPCDIENLNIVKSRNFSLRISSVWVIMCPYDLHLPCASRANRLE
jgi:hypothetical protein